MDLEHYNRSYDEVVETFDYEVEQKMRIMRQQCVTEFITRLNKREQDWEATFQELLAKSREDDLKSAKEATSLLNLAQAISNSKNTSFLSKPIVHQVATKEVPVIDLTKENTKPKTDNSSSVKPSLATSQQTEQQKTNLQQQQQSKPVVKSLPTNTQSDPYFSNAHSIKEYIRIQQMLQQNKQVFDDISTNPATKTFKNEINLFIRTQINSISNSDMQHLESKIRLLSNLLNGQGVSFQDKFIDARKHPQGQPFSIDLAAQTFVNVGIKLVNSVPAIAQSMGTVINGIVQNNLGVFRDVVIGHLQEQCPYLVPMHINIEDFPREANQELRYKIACGYSYEQKTQALESEEKYLIRMRSMTLIYACFLIQGHLGLAWTWLATFLSLKPQPVISATILQAFLQEASKKLSTTYGRQYRKILNFIKEDYIKMVEEVTPKTSDRQSLIKLKNLLSDDSNLIAGPTITSIFGAIR